MYFDNSGIAAEEIFEANFDSNQGNEKLNHKKNLPIDDHEKRINLPLGQQLATALIQEYEHRDKECPLLFHDKLHANHMLWNLVQNYLNENRIDSVLFFRRPENLIENIVYQVAETHGLNLLILQQSIFDGRFFSYRSLSDFGNFPTNLNMKSQDCRADAHDYFLNGSTETHSRCESANRSDVFKILRFLLRARSLRLFDPLYILRRASHMHDAPSEIENWRDEFAKFFFCSRTAYFEFLTCDRDEDLFNQQFVFFPLQSLRELNPELLINRYADQLLAIEQLSKLLPADCKIIVKGALNSEPDYLTPMFFHRIRRISNVVRVPSCVNSMHLIERCEFLATVNSSQGWDALTHGKKVLVFGIPWYRNLPGVISYYNDIQNDKISATKCNLSELEFKLQELLSRSHSGVLFPNSEHNALNRHKKENAEKVANAIYDLMFNRTDTTFCKSNLFN